MNSTCIPDVGYFDSPKFLSMVLHMNTIISTPIHLFGFYCIIWKTPMIMKSAKLYLLNLHFWIVSFDYSISILMMPFLLIPHYAGYTLGVLSWFDVSVLFQTFMGLFFLANMAVSIVVLFESRFYTVCEFAWKPYYKRCRKAGIIIYHVVVSCITVSLAYTEIDQEPEKRRIFKELPCLPQYIYEANIFVLCGDYSFQLAPIVVMLWFASVMVLLFAALLAWNLLVQLRSHRMSQRTYQLQNAFLIALVIQIMVPLCTFIIPITYIELAIVYRWYKQSFTNFGICLVSMHGVTSSLTMVLVHRPYRDALLNFFEENVTVRFGESSFRRFLRYRRDASVAAVSS
ncbi:unnamed protein product [Caenorhabditis nigoni]